MSLKANLGAMPSLDVVDTAIRAMPACDTWTTVAA
jgi:hypothetical protein